MKKKNSPNENLAIKLPKHGSKAERIKGSILHVDKREKERIDSIKKFTHSEHAINDGGRGDRGGPWSPPQIRKKK
jgi:hypothetical protein